MIHGFESLKDFVTYHVAILKTMGAGADVERAASKRLMTAFRQQNSDRFENILALVRWTVERK